ncbi:response regulator (plasmid) [Agrobacterium tumefaciens]|nr:response regulator [Agrobacterium tumefaciens]
MNNAHRLPMTVLIVEDDALIRMDVADYLASEQINPVEAVNADEALAILQKRDDIQIVFTDVNMPGAMDGIELARLVRERWPALGIIVASGMVRPQRSTLPDDARFFEKPYDLERLSASMRAMVSI